MKTILAELDRMATKDQLGKGKFFEPVVKKILETAPEFRSQYKNVWLWDAPPIPPPAFRRNRSYYDSHHRTAFCSNYHSDRARTVCLRVWSRGCRHCRTRESPHLSVAIHFRGS